jgi:FkbM family methyltransferase
MSRIVSLAKAIMAQTPYRIVRDKGANRFQAIETCLRAMRERGFEPKVVIDGGAHLGSFSVAASQIFPAARFHLVEPQPACRTALRALCSQYGFVLHECALAATSGTIQVSECATPSTGVHVVEECGKGVPVAAATLDGLFGFVTPADRTLLKLDLQGYELHALRGAASLLSAVEAILTEVSFFAQAYEPSIAELVSFLSARGFRLYDIAALAARTRDNRLHQGDLVFVREGTPLLADNRWD